MSLRLGEGEFHMEQENREGIMIVFLLQLSHSDWISRNILSYGILIGSHTSLAPVSQDNI